MIHNLYIASIAFLILYAFIFIKMAAGKGIFIMNPLFFVHNVAFSIASRIVIFQDLPDLRLNVQYVYLYTVVVSFITLLIFYKQLFKPVTIEIPHMWKLAKYARRRNTLFVIFIILLFILGIYKGVITGLIRGYDIEGLRVESLVGIGFITEIPQMCLFFFAYVYCIGYCKTSPLKAGMLCAFLAIFYFLTTGFRTGMLHYGIVFIIYFSACRRNLKWYEYLIWISIIPVAAAITGIYRSGQEITKEEIVNYSYDTRKYEISAMSHFEGDATFYWGEEYKYGALYIIPRFLWKDKPMTFANDIIKKDVMNANFAGGGVAYSDSVSTFINFGYYGWIAYFLWLLFLHILYGKIIIPHEVHPYYKILLLVYFLRASLLSGSFISGFYLIVLSAILLYFCYGAKKVL
jgi:hypothetical protein